MAIPVGILEVPQVEQLEVLQVEQLAGTLEAPQVERLVVEHSKIYEFF